MNAIRVSAATSSDGATRAPCQEELDAAALVLGCGIDLPATKLRTLAQTIVRHTRQAVSEAEKRGEEIGRHLDAAAFALWEPGLYSWDAVAPAVAHLKAGYLEALAERDAAIARGDDLERLLTNAIEKLDEFDVQPCSSCHALVSRNAERTVDAAGFYCSLDCGVTAGALCWQCSKPTDGDDDGLCSEECARKAAAEDRANA